jgi:hypothetical protein
MATDSLIPFDASLLALRLRFLLVVYLLFAIYTSLEFPEAFAANE